MPLFYNPVYLATFVLALLIYWRVLKTENARDRFLLIVCLLVLGSLHPFFIAFALGISCFIPLILRSLERKNAFSQSALMGLLTGILLILLVGKYGKPALASLFHVEDSAVRFLIVPLGISYFVLRLIQYCVDRYRGVIQTDSFVALSLFLFFLPTFPAGPLENYQSFYKKRLSSPSSLEIGYGLKRILIGYFKKAVLVDLTIPLYFGHFLSVFPHVELTSVKLAHPAASLLFVAVKFITAYLDLSAYTDLAIGLSLLFGFSISENFNYPFLKKNLSDFWSSWHCTLSRWCRDQVYFPILGFTRKPWAAVFAAMLVMGLWHFASTGWTAWGLYHATGLVVVGFWLRFKRKKRIPFTLPPLVSRWLGTAMTLWFVAMGYALVSLPSLGQAFTTMAECLEAPFLLLKYL